MAKIIQYWDEGRGPNWDEVIEDEVGVDLDGQKAVFIARTNDPCLYLISTSPISKEDIEKATEEE